MVVGPLINDLAREFGAVIHGRQDPERPSAAELVIDEVHRPVLVGCRRCRRRSPMQADHLAPATTHSQLQAFQAIETVYALAPHGPAFPAQHHHDPFIAESGPGLSEITNAHTQCGLVLCLASVIPGRSLYPGQSARATGAYLKPLMDPMRDILATNWPQ